MVLINYLGKNVSLEEKVVPENMTVTRPPKFEEASTYDHKYVFPDNDYDAVEVDFLGAGPGWEIRGMFIPGNSRPYVLRNLPGPEKYRTKKHEFVHKDFYDSGIPQSESEVRRITSTITNFTDYYM